MAAPPKGGWGKHPKRGGRETTTTNFGWCCFCPSLTGRCCLFPHPLGGAAFLHLFWWVVLLGLLLLWVMVLSPLRALGWCCLSRNQHHPKEWKEGRTTKRRVPLKGRRRDHHSTGLSSTSVNATNLNSFFKCYFFNEQHHPKGDREKITPTPRRRRKGAVPKRRGELLPPLLLLGGGAFSLSLRSPRSFGGVASLPLLWVVLPSSAFFGWRGHSPFRMKWKDIKMNSLHLSVWRWFAPPPPLLPLGWWLPYLFLLQWWFASAGWAFAPSLPCGGGSYSTPSGWAFAPSFPSAGGSPPPRFPVGSQPPSPLVGVRPPLPSSGRPALPSGGCWVWCCVAGRLGGECRGVRSVRFC